jgi:hypothetical protein
MTIEHLTETLFISYGNYTFSRLEAFTAVLLKTEVFCDTRCTVGWAEPDL